MEEKYKILIVDDEQSILDMLKLQLEFEGYSVYTAGNAAEALDKLSYSPDIVLLDINMGIGFLIMTLAYTTEAGSACFEMVEKSSILRFLYETNPLLIRLLKF